MTFLTSSLAYILTPFLLIGASIGTALAPRHDSLGASQEIPTTIAFFETTLASAITSSATSFTLTSATDADGTSLASSTYAFVIDEGSSNEEIVLADCTGTTCTNAERGISVRTGNTEVTALKKAHRRGASVKITDAPLLPLVARILRGEGTVDFTPSTGGNLVTKTYVDGLALGTTTVAATYTDDGLGELATGVQAASSTATDDSGSPLMLHTRISTSTAPSTGSYVVVTDADGNIDSGFLDFTEWLTVTTITATGTGVWTKPSYGNYALIEMWGGGGGGASGDTYEGGGGGGGYRNRLYSFSELSATTSYTIGGGGAPNFHGGTTTFGTISAYGGGPGAYSGATANAAGGGGGGQYAAGGTATTAAGTAGSPGTPIAGTGGDDSAGVGGIFGGGGGGGGNAQLGGGSYYGGGGGGSTNATSGGRSVHGGDGGYLGSAPQVPGGGGSADQYGAKGSIKITIF